jgi:hypothetical protein
MRKSLCAALVAVTVACWAGLAPAYVEAPYTLGRVCAESPHIVLMEVSRVNKEKGIVIYKKVKDLKGKHAEEEIKHNIGKRGFHAREWQTILNWAEVGKKAVFFHNGGQSETCIGDYWYQCYREGAWWGMTHAEPFLLRTFYGSADKLAAAVPDMLQGREVIVTCLQDANREQMHLRKGKVQRLKASLKRLDYNPRRDFVAFGGDGDDVPETKTVVLVAESSAGWRFLPVQQVAKLGDRWRAFDFDEQGWRTGQAPVGYGEAEIAKRKGTTLTEKGQAFVFRRQFEVPQGLLTQKGVTFRLCVASDDSASVWLNGALADNDPSPDHEFSYWNRDVEVPAKAFRPGHNVLAVEVRNRPQSSDLYFDVEVSASYALPKKSPAKAPPGK